jgi:hypothetical protein
MSLVVRAAPALVREAAVQVLRDDLGARNVSADPGGRLHGRTRPSWRSWGEDLTVRIDPADDGSGVRVFVESLSVVRVVQVDWGKNGSNERCFYQALRDRMEAIAPGSVIWPPGPRRDGGWR